MSRPSDGAVSNMDSLIQRKAREAGRIMDSFNRLYIKYFHVIK
jgi:hypothetical protein